MTTFSMVAGDTGTILRVTCTDRDSGAAIDLSGATVALRWQRPSDGTLISKAMSVQTPATAGIAQYQFAAGEIQTPVMRFEVQITDSGGTITRSTSIIEETVRAPLA